MTCNLNAEPKTPLLAERLKRRAWRQGERQDCAAVIEELTNLFSAARIAGLTKIHYSTISNIRTGKIKATMAQEERLIELRGRLRRAGLLAKSTEPRAATSERMERV